MGRRKLIPLQVKRELFRAARLLRSGESPERVAEHVERLANASSHDMKMLSNRLSRYKEACAITEEIGDLFVDSGGVACAELLESRAEILEDMAEDGSNARKAWAELLDSTRTTHREVLQEVARRHGYNSPEALEKWLRRALLRRGLTVTLDEIALLDLRELMLSGKRDAADGGNSHTEAIR